MKDSIHIDPADCQKIKDALVVVRDIQTELKGYREYGFAGTARELHTQIEAIRQIIDDVTHEDKGACAWNHHFDIVKIEDADYACYRILHHGQDVGTVHYEEFLDVWFAHFIGVQLPSDIAFVTKQEAIAFAQGYCTTLDVQSGAFRDEEATTDDIQGMRAGD